MIPRLMAALIGLCLAMACVAARGGLVETPPNVAGLPTVEVVIMCAATGRILEDAVLLTGHGVLLVPTGAVRLVVTGPVYVAAAKDGYGVSAGQWVLPRTAVTFKLYRLAHAEGE